MHTRTITIRNGLAYLNDRLLGEPLPKIREVLSEDRAYTITIFPSNDGDFSFEYNSHFNTYRMLEHGEYRGSICARIFKRLFFEPLRSSSYCVLVRQGLPVLPW